MLARRLLAGFALGSLALGAPRANAAEPASEVYVQPLPPPPQPTYPQSPYPAQPQYQAPPWTPPPRYEGADRVPPGYHIEDEPRHGLVVAGWTLLLVPYALGAVTALGTKGDNQSSWLYAPVIGPWFVLAGRSYAGCDQSSADVGSGLGCVADVFAVMGLIVDGVLQAAGVTLLALGYLNPRHELVRDQPALRIFPARVGTGEGIGLRLTF
jgi:hypothetical protein